MSRHLTLELSDEVYADLQQKANSVGLSIAEWIVTVLSNQSNGLNKVVHPMAQQEARQRFRNHAGAISLGYATGIDNESIDADLARAYADEY
jgi:chlorite dismutase